MKEIEQVNIEFYNSLYRKKNRWIAALHPFFSFDQQSKSKANFEIIKRTPHLFDGAVLDYGFGHGSFLLKFPKRTKLFGVDISEEAVANFPRIAAMFKRTVRTATPGRMAEMLVPASLDLICMSHVLEHVDDDAALVRSLREYLKEGGYILINIPINEVWEDPKHIRQYNSQSAQKLLEEAGFEVKTSMQFDKITAFLLDQEMNRRRGKIKKLTIRTLRFMLSFVSFSWHVRIDKWFLSRFESQQLLLLAKKK